MADAISVRSTQLRLFAGPSIDGQRRLGVGLVKADDIENAIATALEALGKINIVY